MIIPNLKEEEKLYAQNYQYVAGVDEVGRGAWAGSVVAAAIIMKNEKGKMKNGRRRIYKIRDSKSILAKKRETLFQKIKEQCLDYSIGIVEAEIIDKIGIGVASKLAMKRAISNLKIKPDFILIDAFKLPEIKIPTKAIKKGDRYCLSIASASIVAKVVRDKMMIQAHQKFPRYGFDKHKGYGTRLHQERLKKYGHCSLHRKSFSPIKNLALATKN